MSPMYSTRTALLVAGLAYGTSASFVQPVRQTGSLEPSLWGVANAQMDGWAPLTRSASDPRVVISLTTVPAGLHGLGLVLSSLRNQTVAADAIEINLPGQSNRHLGKYKIQDLSDEDGKNVSVYRTDDWFALTSLIPTVRRAHLNNQSTLVIIVDDDKVYPPTLVEDHLRAHRNNPRSANTCRGYKVPPGGDIYQGHFFTAWDDHKHSVYGDAIGKRQRVAVVTGSDSWSVPSDAFTSKLWDDLVKNGYDTSIATSAKMMNDIYASGQLSKLEVPKYVIPCRRQCQDAPKTRDRAKEELSYFPGMRQKRTSDVMRFFANDWRKEEVMSAAEVSGAPTPSASAKVTMAAGKGVGTQALLWAERVASGAAHTLR